MPQILRVGVAVLLIAAIAPWPYGYYQFLRWVVTPMAAYLAFRFGALGQLGKAMTWGVITILFNPFAPISLVRVTWNMADVVVAVLFIFMGTIENKRES